MTEAVFVACGWCKRSLEPRGMEPGALPVSHSICRPCDVRYRLDEGLVPPEWRNPPQGFATWGDWLRDAAVLDGAPLLRGGQGRSAAEVDSIAGTYFLMGAVAGVLALLIGAYAWWEAVQ